MRQSSRRFPRYTTFPAYERERLLQATCQTKEPTAPRSNAARQGSSSSTLRRLASGIDLSVTYPDGTTGTCRYTRLGPRWHKFQFRHGDPDDETASLPLQNLPIQYSSSRLERDDASIQAAAQAKAPDAFAAAIREECKLAQRVSAPPSTRLDPGAVQFSHKKAKEWAGLYAVCIPLATKLLPVTCTFECLTEANDACAALALLAPDSGPKPLVALACRWSRQWQPLRFNAGAANTDSNETGSNESEPPDDSSEA